MHFGAVTQWNICTGCQNKLPFTLSTRTTLNHLFNPYNKTILNSLPNCRTNSISNREYHRFRLPSALQDHLHHPNSTWLRQHGHPSPQNPRLLPSSLLSKKFICSLLLKVPSLTIRGGAYDPHPYPHPRPIFFESSKMAGTRGQLSFRILNSLFRSTAYALTTIVLISRSCPTIQVPWG